MMSLSFLLLSLIVASSMAQSNTWGFYCARKGERCGVPPEKQACCLTSSITNKPMYCSGLAGVCAEMDDGSESSCAKEGESCLSKECCEGLFGSSLQCNGLKRCVKQGSTCAAKGESCSYKDCCTSTFTPLKCNSFTKKCVESTCTREGQSCQENHECCSSDNGRLTCDKRNPSSSGTCKDCARVDESCDDRECCSGFSCRNTYGRRVCRN